MRLFGGQRREHGFLNVGSDCDNLLVLPAALQHWVHLYVLAGWPRPLLAPLGWMSTSETFPYPWLTENTTGGLMLYGGVCDIFYVTTVRCFLLDDEV